MNNCIFVIGPESSGSMLVAKISAHVLGIKEFGSWDGVGWCLSEKNILCHRSLPYGLPPVYPNIKNWISNYSPQYEIKFIITTRDIKLSELSRIERFSKTYKNVQKETLTARDLIVNVMNSKIPYIIWSYETFIFLEKPYLDLLYNFLGVSSDFIPSLKDANKIRIENQLLKKDIFRAFKIIRNKFRKNKNFQDK